MLYISLVEAGPGMVVAKPVRHGTAKSQLLVKGAKLDARNLRRLRDLGVKGLWVECEGLEGLNERINEKVIEKRLELNGMLAKSMENLGRRVDARFECQGFDDKIAELVMEILTDPTHEAIIIAVDGGDKELTQHHANCCYVSLLIGTKLSGYVRHQRRRVAPQIAGDLGHLGMGAFVHDVGKVRLPKETRNINILDENNTDKEYRSHVSVGCELLRGKMSPIATYMVAHHHQRFDGSGFPLVRPHDGRTDAVGLAGERIHVFARVLAIVDVFDHLLGPQPTSDSTIKALFAIQQPRFKGWFDPLVSAALVRLIPPFMVGTVVKLTDETDAVVVANDLETPCQPTVRRIVGAPGMPGSKVSEERINLSGDGTPAVASVGGMDVRPFFYVPPAAAKDMLGYWGLGKKSSDSEEFDPSAMMDAESEPAEAAAE